MKSHPRTLKHPLILAALLLSALGRSALAGSANGDVTQTSLLGSPPQVIEVSPAMGAAGLSQSCDVPPGRAGMQPALDFSYSSGSSGPSPLGRGWSMSLPYIRRSTRFGQPWFNWTDTFALDWYGAVNDLVLFSDQTSGGVGMREYRTQIETFMRVRNWTLPGGFTYWQVEDGGGRRYEFGNPGSDGNPTQSGNFSWALNRVEDSHGNYMVLDWFIDAGTLYPLAIHYAGHVSDLTPTNHVRFTYEGRYDIISERLGVAATAANREMRYRLRRIKTWAGTQAAGVCLFDYMTAGTGVYTENMCDPLGCGSSSQLCMSSGQTVTCNNTCDTSTGFCQACSPNCCVGSCGTTSQSCPDGSIAECPNACDSLYGCRGCVPQCDDGGGGGGGGCGGGDFAGGYTTMSGPIQCDSMSPVAPPDTFEYAPVDPETDGASGGGSGADMGASLLAAIRRFSGDGSLSLPATTFEYVADVSSEKQWLVSAAALPVVFLDKVSSAQGRQIFDHGVQIEDFNGDAKPDLLVAQGQIGDCQNPPPPRAAYVNNSGSWPPAGNEWIPPVDFVMWDCSHGQYDQGVRLVDINGDARPDIVQSYVWEGYPQFTKVWLNYGNGYGWREPPNPAAWNIPAPFVYITASGGNGVQSDDLGVRFADVDGDGWIDLVRGRTSNSDDRDVFLNNRTSGWDATVSSGWKPPVAFVHHYPGSETVDLGVRMLDLNGDGMADIIQSVLLDMSPVKHVWLSKGRPGGDGNVWVEVSGWEIPQFFAVTNNSNDDSDDMGVRFGDVNGDGLVDLVVARFWEGTTPSCTTFGSWGGSSCHSVYLQRPGSGWYEDAGWSSAIPPGYNFIEHRTDAEDYDDGVRLADVDANGTIDFLRGVDGWSGGPHEWRKNQDRYSDLLTKTNNGVGGAATIAYSSSGVETGGQHLLFTFPIVKSVTTSDGLTGTGHSYVTTYAYGSGYYHSGRHEFRGFSTVTESLSGSAWRTVRSNNQEIGVDVAPLAGSPYLIKLLDQAGTELYKWSGLYDRSHGGPAYLTNFHFLNETTETFKDLPNFTRTVVTEYSKTLEGGSDPFITAETVRRHGGSAAEDFDSTTEYINDPTTWRIGFAKRRFIADFHSDPTAPLAQTWFYYDNLAWGHVGAGGVLTKSEIWTGEPGDANGSSANRTTTASVDDFGNVTGTVDAAGHTTSIDYAIVDATRTFPERVRVTTDDDSGPVVHERTFVYDPRFGARTLETTPSDGDIHFEYDLLGRLVRTYNQHDSSAQPTTCNQYVMGPVGVRISSFRRETSGVGEWCGPGGMLGSSTFLDGLGRLIQNQSETEDSLSVAVGGTVTYDGEGNVGSVTVPYRAGGSLTGAAPPPAGTAMTTFLYDQLGRRTVTTLPGGGPPARVVTNTYEGWKIRTVDPEDIKTEVDLDSFSRVRARRTYLKPGDGGGLYATTSMEYDRLGRLRFVIYPESGGITPQLEHQYNGFGERIVTIDPDAGSLPAHFTYTKDGLLDTYTDPAGQITSYTYDALHRVLHEDHSDGSGARYRYDETSGRPGGLRPIGHLTSVIGLTSGVSQAMQYDDIGRMNVATEQVDGLPRTVRFAHDALGRIKDLTYPDDTVLHYTYRPDGHASTVYGLNIAGQFANSMTYTAWGALSYVRYGNSVEVTNQFDAAATWLTGIRACIACGQTYETKVVDSQFSHDRSGHITFIDDRVDNDDQTFVLDQLYRIKTATAPASYGGLTFDHDVRGNLALKDGVTFSHAVPGKPHQLSGDSSGRAFTYDLNGNLAWVTTGGGVRHYVYNARQQIESITDTASGTETANVFNPQGQRVKREVTANGTTSTTIFVSNLYEESEVGTRKHVYLEGRRIATVEYDATTELTNAYYLVENQVGSLQAMTDRNGEVKRRVRYKPYGEVFAVEGNGISLGPGFAGATADDTLGLNDFGARFYDPTLGRFVGVDPIVANPMNVMDQNPYAYARGNPVSWADVGGFGADECPGDACLVVTNPPGGGNQGASGVSVSFSWDGFKGFAGNWWHGLKGNLHSIRDAVHSGYRQVRNGVRNPRPNAPPQEGGLGPTGQTTSAPTSGTPATTGPGPRTAPGSTGAPGTPSLLFAGGEAQVSVTTEIRRPDAKAGMKSTQVVLVDTDRGEIQDQSYHTGRTRLFSWNHHAIRLPSRGDAFTAEVIANDPNEMTVELTGETASWGFPFMINYDFTLTYDRTMDIFSLAGAHDGYPSYVVSINGQRIYDYQQGSSLFYLAGSRDVVVGE